MNRIAWTGIVAVLAAAMAYGNSMPPEPPATRPSAPPGMSREEMVKRAAVIVVGTLQPYDKRVLLPAGKGDKFRYSVVDIQVEEVLKGNAGLKTVPLRNCVGFVEPFHESTPGVYQSRGKEPRGIWVLTAEGGQYVGACFDIEDKAKIAAILRPGEAEKTGTPDGPAVAWGKEVNGVQAGLRPVKAAFEPKEAIELEVHLRNAGDKAVNLTNAGSPYIAWQVTFQRKGAGASPTLLAKWTQAPVARLRPVPVALAKGEAKIVKLTFDETWMFEDVSPRRRGKPVEPLKSLPEGVYEVTAAYTQGAPADKEWWGTLIAGPAEVRVGKAPAAEGTTVPRSKPDGNTPTTSPTSRPAVGAKEIDALIEQLGDREWKVRETASEKLIAIGKPARSALEAKQKEKDLDPEVASRLEQVLERLLGDAEATDEASGIMIRITHRGELIEASKDGKTLWQTGVPGGAKDLKIEKGNVKVLPIHWTLDIKTGKVVNIGTQEGRIIRLQQAGAANVNAERLAKEAAKAAAMDAAMRDRRKAEDAAAAKQAEEEAKRKAQAEEAARRAAQERN